MTGLFLTWFGVLQILSAHHVVRHAVIARRWLAIDCGLLLGLVLIAAFERRCSEGSRCRPTRFHLQNLLAVARQGYVVFLILPLAYSEAGSFGTTLVPSLEKWLIAADRYLFGLNWSMRRPPMPGTASTIFESAYLANYALLLLAFVLAASLQMARPAMRTGWRERLTRGSDPVVLHTVSGSLVAALLLCYALFPLLPAVTPRLYFPGLRHPAESSVLDVNWYLLARYSIPYGIFPSGHVAGPVAIGCALLARRRRLWAAFFLIAAATIAVATVYGNYHFISDAVAGWLAGIVAWFLVERMVVKQVAARIVEEAPAAAAAEWADELRSA